MTLITPQIGSFYRPSAPVSSGYSTNLTAGDFNEGAVVGFDRIELLLGSIDEQPIAGHDLLRCAVFVGSNSVAFNGDCTTLLDGLSVYVDGTLQYTPAWNFNGSVTLGEDTTNPFPFVDGTTYFVEIK